MFKANRQRYLDRDRVVYELTFPDDLEPDRVVAFLRSISSAYPRRSGLGGVPTYSFELWARKGRIRALLRVPEPDAAGIVRQLNGLIPRLVAARREEPLDYDLSYAVEVAMSSPSRPLDIKDASDVSTSILKSIDALTEDEQVVVQLVVTPATKQRLPERGTATDTFSLMSSLSRTEASKDEVVGRREKLMEPNFRGVLRVGAKAKTEHQARLRVDDVRKAFTATSSHATFWRIKRRHSPELVKDIKAAHALPFGAHIQVSAPELAALIGWRMKGAQIAGLPAGRSQFLAASPGVPSDGRVFGRSNHPSDPRRLAVTVEESCKHWHIVGRTGSGKSTLLANLAAQDIAAGRGICLIDPKQDLCNAVSNYVPRHRLDDVVLFDVDDISMPVGFNMLGQGSPQTVASEVQTIFDHIYSDKGAVRMPEVMYHLLITLMTTTAETGPYTFVDMIPLINATTREEAMFAKAVIDGVQDPYIKGWWANLNKLSAAEKAKYFQSLRSRIWQLNSRAEVRNIIGQTESSIDLTEIVRDRKILLVNLKGVPEEVGALIGSLIVNNLWHVAKAGYTSERDPFMLYLDEFQHFVHSPISPDTMLAEGRSFGLSMHLAHQGLDQLNGRKTVEAGVMNNAVNKIVFQRGRTDAAIFASEFGLPVTDNDLKRLGKFEFMARVASSDGVSPPLSGITLPPLEPFGYGREVRERSRLRYGRPAHEVDAEIQRRRQVKGTDRVQRPKVGEEAWTDEV